MDRVILVDDDAGKVLDMASPYSIGPHFYSCFAALGSSYLLCILEPQLM